MEVFFSLSESQILSMSKTNGSIQAAIAAFPAVKLRHQLQQSYQSL